MKNIKYLIIVFCILLACIISLLIFKEKRTNISSENFNNVINNNTQVTNIKYEKVKSATSFFTVQTCINKYISYINANDNDSVYKILDNEYILKNNITKQNVLEKLKLDDYNSSIFQADKMYMEQIDDNNVKYYVHGILKKGYVKDYGSETIINNNFQMIVTLNFEDMIFSAMPLENGGIFNEESN